MSEVKPETLVQIQYLIDNVDKIPKDRFIGHVVPLANNSNEGGYEWNAGFVGITDDKKLIYLFESGCSCYGPDWDSNNNEIPEQAHECKDKTVKGLELSLQDEYFSSGGFGSETIEKGVQELYDLVK